MDFKKKLNAFFTVSGRSSGGFTLVEMVVVIAVLAILAGVSVPVYNGFVEKSNESADQVLLAAVNRAFATACAQNQVEVANVTEASISLFAQTVQGLSTVTATATETSAVADINKIAPAFDLYFQENENKTFRKQNVNSLRWNDAEDTFELDGSYTSMRVTLSSGEVLVVSAEDIATIQASAYADMGYEGVAAVVNGLSGSTETLCAIAKGFGMLDRFTAVMAANGLLPEGYDPNSMSAAEAANGLQMVTAKYLAGGSANLDELLNTDFSAGSRSMLTNILVGDSGTKTVAAAALQYAMMEAFASNPEYQNETITVHVGGFMGWGGEDRTMTIAAYLTTDEARNDPLGAMAKVQNTSAYSSYKETDQYNNDLNGFVGTMSILGDNLGTTTNPGAVSIEGYFQNGINSDDAREGLTEVLGP